MIRQAINAIYTHIMDNKILKKDRYDIIMVNNYYSFYGVLDIYNESYLKRLIMKYGKELCIESIQT